MRSILRNCGRLGLLWLVLVNFAPALPAAESGASTWSLNSALEQLAINGEWNEDQARVMIQAVLKGLDREPDKVIYATSVQQAVFVARDQVRQQVALRLDALQGELKEVAMALSGEGLIREVTGAGLRAWSLRRETDGTRSLVLRFEESKEPRRTFAGMIIIETPIDALPATVSPLTLTPEPAALFHGYVRLDVDAALAAEPLQITGLIGIDRAYLPADFTAAGLSTAEPVAYRFQGAGFELVLEVSVGDPEARRVVLTEKELHGSLATGRAAFALTAIARVRDPKGGSLELLSRNVALTRVGPQTGWRLVLRESGYVFECDRAGDYVIELEFNPAVWERDGWQSTQFKVAPSAVQPLVLRGLGADTQFLFPGAARPRRVGADFVNHLRADGEVRFAWKEARPEAEGRLFYAVESLSQVSVGSGLLRQVSWLDFKVMQGEVQRVVFRLAGEGEVTRVLGPQVLAWTVEADAEGGGRRLVVQLNQPQKAAFALEVQSQRALGAFPQTMAALRLQPEDATRFGGYIRVVNDGAVRLEVIAAEGLSQISPEQFPVNQVTQSRLALVGTQQFAYRFAGAAFDLQMRADNILPELGVSALLVYRLGETEMAIDAELELEIREAPLRELILRIPKDFALARLTASGLSDYFVTDTAEPDRSQVRLVYGTPVEGRQLVQVRLERNRPFEGTGWTLPRIEIDQAKSVRGHVGVVAEAGYRLTPTATEGLADVATAFFPKKVEGLQAAFRLREANWQATLGVERLPQSIQADGFHLFSIGEGIAYGSSVIHYVIAGAPVSAFELELSPEYFNVEFTGKDVRNWQKTTNGFQVQLHTPVAGAYTLLATYERPFRSQGETLTFTGARPRDAQSEQGHTLVISAYQFEVQPDNVSTNLLRLEPGEVPAEYRLFFDAPILAAYRYANRPFTLDLALQPLAQGETVGQVIDRARLTTRISKEGQVLTDARYFIKNKGLPHLQMAVPGSLQLWSATVNGTTVVPVTTTNGINLIPLPQHGDPNAVQELNLKLASRSANPRNLVLQAPVIAAPVLLVEWKLEPEVGRRLIFRSGSLNPAYTAEDDSGFAGILRLLSGSLYEALGLKLGVSVVLAMIAVLTWRWAGRESGRNARFWSGTLIGAVAGLVAFIGFIQLANLAGAADVTPSPELSFVAPVQQPGSALELKVANLPLERSWTTAVWTGWPILVGLAVWIYTAVRAQAGFRTAGWLVGWLCLFWGTLRWPNGAPTFFLVALAFLGIQVLIPGVRRLLAVPRRAAGLAGASVALVWLFAGLTVGAPTTQAAPASGGPVRTVEAMADSIAQDIRVEKENVFGTARLHWKAQPNQVLPILREPAVITGIELNPAQLKLVRLPDAAVPAYALVALTEGTFDVSFQYETQVIEREGNPGFVLPTQYALINEATLTLVALDMDLRSPQAVAIMPEPPGATNTTARLVLAPLNDVWIEWIPRRRDTRVERAVYYAEWAQLYVPAAGVIEGMHRVQIRPAQGQLDELQIVVPRGTTITDVTTDAPDGTLTSEGGRITFWRFDPDAGRLRVGVAPAQSKPFALSIQSQIVAGPLPFEQAVGLLALSGAAGQVGMLGIATGTEVQLDQVNAEGFAPINLEDFPALPGPASAGLTLRRAYRYTEPHHTCGVRAVAVEADVRVEAQQTLSLGEDRVLLAANLNVEITRAGVFKLSFILPSGFDVESISGPALSHWTELGTPEGRVVTLHLKGKTEGQQTLAITLTGPGLRTSTGWAVPRLALIEADKQRGQLLMVPERGMRLRIASREGVTQLDPERAGVREKGILAFRLLHETWQLTVDVEQVDAWIQVTSLQDVTLTDAQIKVAANLQYQIENTSVKALRVSLPLTAEGVQFRGEDVADFLPADDQSDAGSGRIWEIRLHRRIIGSRLLQVSYHLAAPVQASRIELDGVRTLEVNLQRGFVTLRAGGRLQVQVASLPEELQPTEWQVIPRALQQDLPALPANLTFRLVAPTFRLPIEVQRHQAAQLLPARVNRVDLTSVIADNGAMLTRVQLDLAPGDKRLLEVRLPGEAHFWFAFVNQNSVWPWQGDERILLPLEQRSQTADATAVEFFFTSRVGSSRGRSLDLALLGPQFDLPLENITWRVYLSPKWELEDWGGTLELRGQELVGGAEADLDTYFRNEGQIQQQQTQQAEQLLSMANSLLQRGDPGQARRAFQAAYGLSQHDEAFNEDARVQLHNLKLQQALVGLNYRQAAVAGEAVVPAAQLPALSAGHDPVYTQDQALQILSRNSAEENEFQNRLVERLIQQQDAAGASPAAIRATIPEQGRLLTFARSLQVDPWVDLRVDLETQTPRTASGSAKFTLLLGLFVVISILAVAARRTPHSAA